MSGESLEVRKYLWQQDGVVPRHSSGLPAQRNGDEARISSSQVYRAQLAVASAARGAEDCEQLLDMLGLLPGKGGVPPIER